MKILPLATPAIRAMDPVRLGAEPARVISAPTRSPVIGVVQVGRLPPVLTEASGLVTSILHPGVMWMHNDSDHAGVVYGLRPTGELLASIQVENAGNYDWEDITRVQLDGKPCLALCDIGDNLLERKTCVIHLVREPDPKAGDQATTPLLSIEYRYEDGPHDVEAVAADGNRLLLLSKRDRPPILFELPIQSGEGVRVARRLGTVSSIPPPPLVGRLPPAGAVGDWRNQPTAMDISPDGRRLVVLTYTQLCLYERRADESWLEAMQRQPAMLPLPARLRQTEAVGFSRDGRALYVTSEGRGAPIHRVELH